MYYNKFNLKFDFEISSYFNSQAAPVIVLRSEPVPDHDHKAAAPAITMLVLRTWGPPYRPVCWSKFTKRARVRRSALLA